MSEHKDKLAARGTNQLLQCLNRAQRRRCLIYPCDLAATPDVRISATAPSTLETWRPRSMTVRGVMIRCASTTRPDGGRCGRSCSNAICCVSRAAMKLAPKPTTSYRHATAARCGHSITYKGCVAVVTRGRHDERVAHKWGCRSSFPLTRLRRSVAGAREKSRRFWGGGIPPGKASD
jgi:hypothetical protein